ncbi:MAG: Exodeoxyribonuclease alpha chain [Candidatus Binatus sp.]|nr:Exodeoxyribonuclease alpha chain [Candidatus Binatus sp.]
MHREGPSLQSRPLDEDPGLNFRCACVVDGSSGSQLDGARAAGNPESVTEAAKAIEILEGTLDHILYQNDESGYSVAVVVVATERGDLRELQRVTIVGNLAGLEVGSSIRAHGKIEKHPRFGDQFRVIDFETVRPAGAVALERYLASEIYGVGPKTARAIAEHFGDQLGEVLDNTPERMREVPGVGPVAARLIAAAWRDSSGLRELTVFLRGHNVAAAHARRIHKFYGKEALEVVRSDPYVLARTIHGIGFRTADLVAEKLGIPRNSIQRARAAILYLLERMSDEGHVYAPFAYLEGQFSSGLEMEPELAREAVKELATTGEVVVEESRDDDGEGAHTAVYLTRLHEAEVNVATRIGELSAGRGMTKDAIEAAVAAAIKSSPLELSTEQKSALRCALASRVTVITGGPGTGKTTLLRSLLAALAHVGLKPTLAAPTGRAARRLQEASGRDAKTIHRLLEYSPESGGFVRGKEFPLRTNYLIIDEASMMDLELASSVFSALMPNSSILLVGDKDQLPSVGAGSVLKDVIASDFVPVVQLREVYRQARQSLIVANAHRLNRGEFPELANDADGDFFFFERNAAEDVLATIKQLVQNRLVGKFGLTDAREIQVLTPMNRGPLGTHYLNKELQNLLNPVGRELRSGDRTFREGDRVIQLRNNYDKAVFNGSIGRVVAINSEKARVSVLFEETHADYELSELDELALAYAISVHKSQGSQYPAVVMPIHSTHYLMLRRNLLYTAITRAERVCVLVGTRSALQQAVRNQDERMRFSRLAARLHVD